MTEDKAKTQIAHPELMKSTMQLNIVSGEGEIFSGRAKMVIATAQNGDLGIYPGHSQLLATLRPGQVRVIAQDDSESNYYVSGGFIEVQPDIVTILADTMVRAENIDAEQAEVARKNAERILKGRKKGDNYAEVLIELTKALAQLRVARRSRR